jgi:endoglucanase
MKLFRKSLTVFLLTLALLMGVACQSETPDEPDTPDTEAEIPADLPEPSEPSEVIAEGTLAWLASRPLTELTALEMTRVMGHGINLGNTMEACDVNNRIPMRETYIYETMWGQPITTQESINGMKAAGFSTLRIPVAWTNAMNFAVNNEQDYENWEFVIGGALFDRVEEIINYALNAGMIVVVNNHWDHGWWSMFGHPEQEVRDLAMEIYTTMWTQIAERYNHFDARVIFESANEELGDRFNDTTHFSPTGGTLTEDEQYQMLNAVNQKFVDIVRGTGGNNAERFLLVKGFHTCVKRTSNERFSMPDDTVPNKLILGIHYYEPSSYCLQSDGVGNWGTTADVEQMHEYFGMLAEFTKQGYGILLGEWGVLRNFGADRHAFMTNFLALCDRYGIATTLWDTGGIYCRENFIIRCRYDTDDHIDKVAELFRAHSAAVRGHMTIDGIIAAAEETIERMLDAAAARPQITYTDDEAFAWIMFANASFNFQYSVGDRYDPNDVPPGLIPTDVPVTGEGTYTVALDFTGTDAGHVAGIAFSAVAVMNGELLWPGYIMEITEVLINGEPAGIAGVPFTTNDNPTTTRVNLYNAWVSGIPPEARAAGGDLTDATPTPLENYSGTLIETLVVTFNYFENVN